MRDLKSVIDALGAAVVNAPDGWAQRRVGPVFVSDLISDILVSDGEGALLITSLLSDQVLRTAEIIGAAAVVVANRRYLPPSLGKIAAEQGVALFHTPLPKYDVCIRIGQLWENP